MRLFYPSHVTNEIPAECAPALALLVRPLLSQPQDIPATITTTNTTGSPPTSTSTQVSGTDGIPFTIALSNLETVDKCKHL